VYICGQVTSSLNLPLYSKVCLINAAVFVAAATVLVISPATVSAQVTAGEVAVLSCGLIVIVAANALLLRGVLAPLDRLIQRMDRFSIGTPGERLPERGDPVAAWLARSFNAPLARLEAERAEGNARALAAQELGMRDRTRDHAVRDPHRTHPALSRPASKPCRQSRRDRGVRCHVPTPGRVRSALQDFLHDAAAGGIVLLAGAVAAVVWANSPFSGSYVDFWGHYLTLGWGPTALTETLQHWVNDALMVVFFFVVGLEIKRELAVGELRDPRAEALPAAAALGGVVLPALIFVALTSGEARGG
jgi:hypothetical protein